MEILAIVTRILAFIGKELIETLRRPSAVLSLVVGPLLLILAFGAGYDGSIKPLRTWIVVPAGSGLPTDPATYTSGDVQGIQVLGVIQDIGTARQAVVDQSADMLVVVPADVQSRFKAGQQSVLDVEFNQVDPIRAARADILAGQVAAATNRALIERAVAQGESSGLGGVAGAQPIPAAVVASPTRAEAKNLAPTPPAITSFFGPAALALILQHLAVTLLALSLVRERRGRFEIFRIAPVSTLEIIVGKVLGFAVIGGAVAAITMVALVGLLGVPMLAPLPLVVGVIALTLLASLALGTLIAGLSDTERQAVQLSLLVLLASVFFSGFVLAVDEFRPAAQAFAYLLPVTHGISLLQDLMLRGSMSAAWGIGALAVLASTMGLAGWALLRRAMIRA